MITFKDERSDLASHGWHTDISFEPRPARYSMLRMTTLPPTGGDTLFSSAYSHYDMLSLPMREFLSGLKATHSGAMFRHQARKHGFDLHLGPRGAPENVGDEFEASHPIIRTNAVTGFNGLFVNQTFTERIEGLGFDESKVLLEYLFKLQAQAHGTSTFSFFENKYEKLTTFSFSGFTSQMLWCAIDGTSTI